jgi:hypothetical protein
MGEDGPGHRNSGCQQKRRPVDAMKTQDVFTYQLKIGGPVFEEMPFAAELVISVADCCNVIAQRIEPDVDRVLRIIRDRNAPFY